MRRFLILSLLVELTACGWSGLSFPTIAPPPAQDCRTLSSDSWTVATPSEGLQLAVGQSQSMWVSPILEPQCINTVTSVTWTAENPSVASVMPNHPPDQTHAWVTGLAPGASAIKAHIAFSDGKTKDAVPGLVNVAPAPGPPAGSILIAHGEVALEAPPPGQVAQTYQWVPFSIAAPGRVDVLVDWISPLNVIDIVLYQGTCSSLDCGTVLTSTGDDGMKPVSLWDNLAPGAYTIRIDNLGPGSETVRYEVRFTPK